MLKTVDISRNVKTGPISVTYRAGNKNAFGTCPANCELNASGTGCGPGQIDFDYLDALLDSKRRRGFSWTYSHFNPLNWAHKLNETKTTINYSARNIAEAVAIAANKIAPAVTVVKDSIWKNGKSLKVSRDDIPGGPIQIVRCFAEYMPKVNCANCGGKDGPLCARLNRDYVVGFTVHGNGKKKAEDESTPGGCYAAGGPVRLQWNNTANQNQKLSDADALRAWSETLPHNATIRHHVAGDIGKDNF